MSSLRLLLFWVIFPLSSLVSADEEVGRVLFVIGEVSVSKGGESLHQLKRGDTISQGQRLVTGASGHAHLQMKDQGFISLRPDSVMTVNTYQYSPDQPEKSRIKITLDHGVMRSVSGKGAQQNRKEFRLNTKVSAIGIRGTDFTVFAGDEISRVSVRSGGVSMSPYASTCSRAGGERCEGENTVSLFATQMNQLLEFAKGQQKPQLVEIDLFRNNAPDLISPPRQEEDERSLSERAVQTDLLQGAELLDEKNLAIEAEVETRPIQREFNWGRWAHYVDQDHPAVVEMMDEENRVVAVNTLFGLLQTESDKVELPDAGVYRFNLQDYEAYIKRGTQLDPAEINRPELSIDFNSREFQSTMELAAETLVAPLSINIAGDILKQQPWSSRPDGYLQSDPARSNAVAHGVLGSDGTQAGLLFTRPLDGQQSAVGATWWTSPGH